MLFATCFAMLSAVASPRAYTYDDGTTAGQSHVRFFEPVRYRPIASEVAGLEKNVLLLDGTWRIDPKPDHASTQRSFSAPKWLQFKVPGQFAEQGFDIAQDKPVAIEQEFTVPKEWDGCRIFLRFDAIHGGVDYRINGKPLGYSENLFTPVEWEITGLAEPGKSSWLDLMTTVATASERLSHSSGYTGHSLGGIDRSVRLYALPKLHVATLHLTTTLDAEYRNGELFAELGIDNPDAASQEGIGVITSLYDAGGRPVDHSVPKTEAGALRQGLNVISIASRVTNPQQWNAEQPNLYKLVFELQKDGKMLERIERNIGFRKIEWKNRQLFVNGVRVKLAGVCRHEIDPLTGRADTARHAEEDVRLIKAANLNHIRTSHYPPTQELLDACDRIGVYVEPEAPFCWVAPAKDLSDIKEVLTPTSAMIDYCHTHPSVIMWSLANESHWSPLFDHSNKMVKQLDPSRPTTFNHPFSGIEKENADIANRHYQSMPYDDVLKDDPRPFIHGECFFEVYHERTDVAINPGLRELWAHGSADPASTWGKTCASNFSKPTLHAGVPPGAWSHIYDSKRVIGSEIWSCVDDIFVLPGGKTVSSENGNAYWGIFDGWRRPKPEWYYSKQVFSPVWFPVRTVAWQPGQTFALVPVENRYSFTDLDKLSFSWEMNGANGKLTVSAPPGSKGVHIAVPVSKETVPGSELLLRVSNAKGDEVNAAVISLGEKPPAALPQPNAGVPVFRHDGKTISIEGNGFALVLDRATGDFDSTNPKHNAPLLSFPALHVTRHDYGDLEPKAPRFAEFPTTGTRVVEGVTIRETTSGVEVTVNDHYKDFAGFVRWVLDKNGVGKISYDYTYTGADLDTREVGLKALLRRDCDEIKWRRWSEWGVFPEDCISRTEGTAKARRDSKWPDAAPNVKPSWPWLLDQTELGTNDFRSVKFNIREASLTAPGGSGVRVNANADAHFRACLAGNAVKMHILSQCPLAQVTLHKGDRLTGEYSVSLLTGSGK